MIWPVVVIGAGAAGLVAAERAASRGLATLLLEKNRKPGVKILMSGGTRCNLTHATDARGIVAAFGPPGKFLHSALAALSPADLVALVEAEGVATKTEETGKIFPASNKAADVLAAFTTRLRRTACELALGEPVTALRRTEAGLELSTPARTLLAQRLVITTGGKSYPGCGTTGDAYAWLAELGHTIVPPRPALVPITTGEAWVHELSGVTVPDAGLRVFEPGETARALDRRRGSLLFTHFGFSGPVALDISRAITSHPEPNRLRLEVDLLPGRTLDELEETLRAGQAGAGKRQVVSLVPEEVPRRLAEALVRRVGMLPEGRAAELPKPARQALARGMKQTTVSISGTRGYAKAEVTAGGVSLDEVDSRTLASKRVPGLYLAGEVLDLDGPIGGYNFQAAFSTGWLAGQSL